MAINRRRAASSETSSEKKINGHYIEGVYAELISGKTLSGTQKGDVLDNDGNQHSVKSGKKWQIFLYGYPRICDSCNLKILLPCLEVFPEYFQIYNDDRIKCIDFKEKYLKQNGRDAAIKLSNNDLSNHLGPNLYFDAKVKLAKETILVCKALNDKVILRNFFDEAFFNNGEVNFFVIFKLNKFYIFNKNYVLDVFSEKLFPDVSAAGRVPIDLNVAGQKTLFRYHKKNGKLKNIIEIEVRCDSDQHYRKLRFNMYGLDALNLLLDANPAGALKIINS